MSRDSTAATGACRYRGQHAARMRSFMAVCMNVPSRLVGRWRRQSERGPQRPELDRPRHDPELSCRHYPVLVGREAEGTTICFCCLLRAVIAAPTVRNKHNDKRKGEGECASVGGRR